MQSFDFVIGTVEPQFKKMQEKYVFVCTTCSWLCAMPHMILICRMEVVVGVCPDEVYPPNG